MQRRQDFQSTHRDLCKCNNISILLQNQNRFEDKSSAHWACRCEKASLGTYLGDITWMKPLCLQSHQSPSAHCQALTLLSSDSSADSCQACSELFARAGQPLRSSLSGGATQSRLSKFFLRMLERAGYRSLLLEEQVKGHQFFHSLKSSSFSLLLFS